MKVLLTGASGFIGHQVLSQLVSAEIDVVVLGRSLPSGYLGAFVKADLLHSESIGEIIASIQATHMIHLAWYTDHSTYWKSSLNLRWLEATIRLVEFFCMAGGIHIISAGTCAEYDWSYGYCDEINTPLNPTSLYGSAKDATRRMLLAICSEYDVLFSWGRIFIGYGPNQDKCKLIPALIDVFEGKRPPFEVNIKAYRDLMHVEDIASGFVDLLKQEAFGIFNICSGQPLQVIALINLLAESCNSDPDLVLSFSGKSSHELSILIGNNTKLLQLGWRQKHDTSELALRSVPYN